MRPPNVLMIGTGEYTTGYVHGSAADSDKSAGVVALCMFDLRRRERVGELKIAGTKGTKFPGIRNHLRRSVADVDHPDPAPLAPHEDRRDVPADQREHERDALGLENLCDARASVHDDLRKEPLP